MDAPENQPVPLLAVLFDYGGVIAEEGFQQGLYAIATQQGLDPAAVHQAGADAVYDTGYVLGNGSEAGFWQAMREGCGLRGSDGELTTEILRRFTLRPAMVQLVRQLRQRGLTVALLSDQTDWLDRLDARDHFYREFDRLYISYRLGKGKRDPTLFDDVIRDLGIEPSQALFVDDAPGNVERAASRGLQVHLFSSEADCLRTLADITDLLEIGPSCSRLKKTGPQNVHDRPTGECLIP